MKFRWLGFPVLLFVLWGLFAGCAQAENVTTSVPQANLNYLSVYVAEAGGYFAKEGLKDEVRVLPGTLSIAALLSGDVDYSGAGGSGLRAAVKGAPVKGIMYQTDKVTFYLLARPSIAKPSDLRGKKVAVGTPGDTQDRMVTMFARRAGVPSNTLTRIAMGRSTSARIAALQAGSVSAATVDAAGAVRGEEVGLRTLAYLGNLFPMPFQGFVTSEKKIARNPGQIRRWLKAMILSLMFMRERPKEALALGAKKLDLAGLNPPEALSALKHYLRALPKGVPGLPSAEGIKNGMKYDIQIPMHLKKPVPARKLLDLTFVAEVKKEVEKEIQSKGIKKVLGIQ